MKYNRSALNKMVNNAGFRHDGKDYYFRQMVGWSKVTSGQSSFRYYPEGYTFDSAGLALFPKTKDLNLAMLGLLNSKVVSELLDILNPTLNVTPHVLKKIPVVFPEEASNEFYSKHIRISLSDWNAYETSWDFTNLPLLHSDYRQPSLQSTYTQLRTQWRITTLEMQRLEVENNRIFIEAYGLQDELTLDVPLQEITLTCNSWYRYSKKCEQQEPGAFPEDPDLEDRLQADTIREYISYAVGCLFGRYSLDKPGLILANSGDGTKQYYDQITNPTFPPNESGILPLTEADDFSDDLPTGIRKFIRATFGEESYDKNLRFIEDALGKDLRTFLLKDLFKDHVKRYKKRPIYWQVTSPSGVFRCLLYLHRYVPETVGQVLNGYVRPYIKKLEARITQGERTLSSGDIGRAEETKIRKSIDKWSGMITELTEWERDVVYPLATERIALDLDDGVKVNYAKIGAILEPVKGLNK